MEKQISNLHSELIKMKIGIMESEIRNTLHRIAVEMNIDIEKEKWNISPDFTKFIKEEKP